MADTSSDTPWPNALDDLDEETADRTEIRLDQDDEDNEATIVRPIVALDEDDEATIVRPLTTLDEDDEATIVRPLATLDEDDEATIVRPLAGSPELDEGTIIVDRAGTDEGTVVVDRNRPIAQRPGASAPTRRGKRRITLPPVEPGFAPEAVDASGPGAISTYEPRLVPEAPEVAPVAELGPDATRAHAPSMPSVGRRSRRLALIGIVGFGLACAISVVGLVIFAVALGGG
ncbi:MAG: hypothetical protein ACOH1T_10810 [Microbacteriaceae bacterium]